MMCVSTSIYISCAFVFGSLSCLSYHILICLSLIYVILFLFLDPNRKGMDSHGRVDGEELKEVGGWEYHNKNIVHKISIFNKGEKKEIFFLSRCRCQTSYGRCLCKTQVSSIFPDKTIKRKIFSLHCTEQVCTFFLVISPKQCTVANTDI